MSEPIKLTILGTDYSLRTNDEAMLREIAADLDSELKELQQKLPGKPPTTLAVLSALNSAEQLVHAHENELRETERLASEIEAMCEDIEKAAGKK